MKSASLWVFLILVALCIPSQSRADATVRQDSCVVVGPGQVRVYFTVFNLNLPRSICSFEVVAKTAPQPPECAAIDCGAAANWQCSLNGSGGAAFGAMTPASNCIAPGAALGGFYITINPGFCCYRVHYADESGVEFVQSYVCFTLCDAVPLEQRTWGSVKQLYDD